MATARIIAFGDDHIVDVKDVPFHLLKRGGFNVAFSRALKDMLDEHGCVTVEKLKDKKGE